MVRIKPSKFSNIITDINNIERSERKRLTALTFVGLINGMINHLLKRYTLADRLTLGCAILPRTRFSHASSSGVQDKIFKELDSPESNGKKTGLKYSAIEGDLFQPIGKASKDVSALGPAPKHESHHEMEEDLPLIDLKKSIYRYNTSQSFIMIDDYLRNRKYPNLSDEDYTDLLKHISSGRIFRSRAGRRLDLIRRLFKNSMNSPDYRDLYTIMIIEFNIGNYSAIYSIFNNIIDMDTPIKKEIGIYKITILCHIIQGEPERAMEVWNLLIENVYGVLADPDAMALLIEIYCLLGDIPKLNKLLLEYERNIPMHKRSRIIYEGLILGLGKLRYIQDCEEIFKRLQTRVPHISGLNFCGEINPPSSEEIELSKKCDKFSSYYWPESPKESDVSMNAIKERGPNSDPDLDIIGPFIGLETYYCLICVYLHVENYEEALNIANKAIDFLKDFRLPISPHTGILSYGISLANNFGQHFKAIDAMNRYMPSIEFKCIYEMLKYVEKMCKNKSNSDIVYWETLATQVSAECQRRGFRRRFSRNPNKMEITKVNNKLSFNRNRIPQSDQLTLKDLPSYNQECKIASVKS